MLFPDAPSNALPECDNVTIPQDLHTTYQCNSMAKRHEQANTFAFKDETCIVYNCDLENTTFITNQTGYTIYKMAHNGKFDCGASEWHMRFKSCK